MEFGRTNRNKLAGILLTIGCSTLARGVAATFAVTHLFIHLIGRSQQISCRIDEGNYAALLT